MNPYQNSAYQKYKEEAVYNMSPVELLLLLYDEAIKDLKKGKFSLEDKDYEGFELYIDKTTRIIRYLMKTLDCSQPMSVDLRRLYDFILYDFGRMKAGRAKYIGEFDAIIEIIQNLRDGFDGAAKKLGPNGDTHVVKEKRILG